MLKVHFFLKYIYYCFINLILLNCNRNFKNNSIYTTNTFFFAARQADR